MRSRQVKNGQEWSRQVRTGQDRLGQVGTGQDTSDEIRMGQDRREKLIIFVTEFFMKPSLSVRITFFNHQKKLFRLNFSQNT